MCEEEYVMHRKYFATFQFHDIELFCVCRMVGFYERGAISPIFTSHPTPYVMNAPLKPVFR